MKISAEQKTKNRNKIIRATVDLMIQTGFKTATMREIARKAGLGEATIYNYFPNKESILFGYYEDHLTYCTQRLKAIKDFSRYTLQEQLQALFETSLDLYLGDREFVQESFRVIFLSLSQHFGQIQSIRKEFLAIVSDMVQAAVEAEEIPDQPFQDFIHQLFWDHYIGMVLYWLNDDSEQFSSTSVLIDKSLNLACAILKSGILSKCMDIALFLFKQHILSRLTPLKEGLSTLHHLKREFMAEKDAKRHPQK
jgi:AcrR family transcriptional regulator